MNSGITRGCAIVLILGGCSSGTGEGPLGETGGAPGAGGTLAAGGSATGGSGAGGAPTSGGTTSDGGTWSGGAGNGGAAQTGGTPGSGGAASGGTTAADGGASAGGAQNLVSVAEDLIGLRVDDACAGNPAVSVGATCDHATPTGAGYHGSKEVMIAGDNGSVYDVTLRIRGVVEPTNVVGGQRSGTEMFSYMNLNWRTEPFTVGGSVPVDDTDYSQWLIRVGEPEQEYFLNDYQRVGHYIFSLDYEVTIPMAAGTTVSLEGIDSNERLIMNFESYSPDGVDGSINHGQFIELDVISVEAR